MSTPFAVAGVTAAIGLAGIRDERTLLRFERYTQALRNFEWGRWEYVSPMIPGLTPPGRVALELREILGPDRGLTAAGTKAILKGAPTHATKIRLMDDGLVRRDAFFGLTEDGERIKAVLIKYNVTF